MSEMTCPKCHASMRTYERNGVNIEQCTDCRGIFLDRGELEHLVSAEARFAAPPQATAPAPTAQSYASQPHHKRKKSFFEELFD